MAKRAVLVDADYNAIGIETSPWQVAQGEAGGAGWDLFAILYGTNLLELGTETNPIQTQEG
jgi:hypothetical protein